MFRLNLTSRMSNATFINTFIYFICYSLIDLLTANAPCFSSETRTNLASGIMNKSCQFIRNMPQSQRSDLVLLAYRSSSQFVKERQIQAVEYQTVIKNRHQKEIDTLEQEWNVINGEADFIEQNPHLVPNDNLASFEYALNDRRKLTNTSVKESLFCNGLMKVIQRKTPGISTVKWACIPLAGSITVKESRVLLLKLLKNNECLSHQLSKEKDM